MVQSKGGSLPGARSSRAVAPFGRWRSGAQRVPPSGLLLVGMLTVQWGAALAKSLFASLGPAGVGFLRVGVAALVLLVLWRPWRAIRARRYSRADYLAMVAFGLVLAAMNVTFYASLERIPLGVAVTAEFVGPLGVAVAGSRRPLDALWAALAGAGILLLAPIGALGAAGLDPLGLALALLAGGCWAAYILLSARVGRAFDGGIGLALAMAVGAMALMPLGVLGAGSALLQPRLLLLGAGVALLSSVIPYSFELAALRRMSTRAFGVFMSLEPAIAALVGLVALREAMGPRAVLALVFVSVASIGATRSGAHPN